ncbi:winged helix-turn-helix transcriptional regulator [Alphaproteobacteria bacterium]|nr:winged helix-turn-helix transcriptional regulator [Alphaproteobacteria bacterium]MDB3863257.1 winged helix-turn-helix transcriptional regulator [Alphaproteobacteria bacterium]MDB3973648.1 winged helix-turn-helix transcriptional regulator [Alphaproteobacteria bacterium]
MVFDDPKASDEIFISKKCAWLYYVGRLNQNQIAKKVGLSKMRVHRLIAFAEKNGFVKTFVEGGFDETSKYENILKEKYHLKISEVIPIEDLNNDPSEMIAAAGARFIMNQINENNVNEFGIGTGNTLNTIAKWLPKIDKEIDFITVNGSLTSHNSIQTETGINQIAHKTNGECYNVGIPLMVESVEQKKILEKIKFIKEIMNRANNTKVKILGVGGLFETSQIVRSKIFSKESIEKIKQAGAVGEVAGNFFDKNGKFISIKETQKITSADIDSFKKSTTVLVAGGRYKISQIKSVLKSGLFTGLITDEETAKQL